MEDIFNRREYPDGSDESERIVLWIPWIDDCLSMMDGDGTFRHFFYGGSLNDQPFVDMDIYKTIQRKWNELRNDELTSKFRNS